MTRMAGVEAMALLEAGKVNEGLAHLWREASNVEPWRGQACTLATADAAGRPSARMVLVKEATAEAFPFFTNYHSRKSAELTANPQAALLFFWPKLEAQLRVEGPVTRASAAESDAYFAARPRLSQLGAWASQQSEPLEDKDALQAALSETELRFPGETPIPRPPHWGGFVLRPRVLELWLEGEGRLHQRLQLKAMRDTQPLAWRQAYLFP